MSSPLSSHNLSLAVCLAGALATPGCVSSQDIQGLQNQLTDIQKQMLQLQKQAGEAPSKQEVTNLQSSVGQQMQGLLKTEADMQVKLQDLSGQIEALQAKLEDTNYRLSQLSQQIATTNQELKAFRSQPPAATPQRPRPPPAGRGGAAAAAAPAACGRRRGRRGRDRSQEPLRRRLQRLSEGELRPRHARGPGVPDELPRHRPLRQRGLLDRRVLLPAAPLPAGDRAV